MRTPPVTSPALTTAVRTAETSPAKTPETKQAVVQDKLDKLVTQARGKVVEAALNEAAKEHTVGSDFAVTALARLSGNVKLGEEIALKNTKVFETMVAPDRLRAAYAKANDNATWVKTRALLGGGASASFSPTTGVGISLGFTGNVEVSSIMAQKASTLAEHGDAALNQLKSMVYPVDAEGLLSLKPAPGSEWMFRGLAAANAGVTAGHAQTYGPQIVNETVTVGASLGVSAQAVYTKNIKVLEDNLVFVRVGRATNETVAGSLGATAKLNINTQGAITEQLTNVGVETVDSGIAPIGKVDVAKEGGKFIDGQLNAIEKATTLDGAVSASNTHAQTVLAQAVLDLKTPEGRFAFERIIRERPSDAADFINKSGLGTVFHSRGESTTTAARLNLGKAKLLNTSTRRNSETGTVEKPEATTDFAEATFARSVAGLLPRFLKGEEREVSVRAGSVKTDENTEQQAVAMRLAIRDTRMHGLELQQLERFSKAVGLPLDGLPAPKEDLEESLGDGGYTVEMAMTDEQLRRFERWNPDAIRLAFASAQKDIEGTDALPPWYSKKEQFDDFARQLNIAQTQGRSSDRNNQLTREYRSQFPGRDLGRDIRTVNALKAMVEGAAKVHGKPVEEWGPVLEALGGRQSTDVRVALLALRRLSGAAIVSLSAEVDGKKVNVKPEATAPKTMAELVGELMAPPA